MTEPVLRIEGLTKRFGGLTAVNGVDFVMPGGELHAIIGPNGAGKTTLFNLVSGLLSGYIVLQYADTRAAYPAEMTGRAMALFTMAMFLGVAFMQWFTGAVASMATAQGLDPFAAVLATIGILLSLGAAGFAWLPKPPRAA